MMDAFESLLRESLETFVNHLFRNTGSEHVFQ